MTEETPFIYTYLKFRMNRHLNQIVGFVTILIFSYLFNKKYNKSGFCNPFTSPHDYGVKGFAE